MNFSPSAITTFELRNEYAVLNMRVRLEGEKDRDDEFHMDDSRVYDVRYVDANNTHVLLDGHKIQQLDLNDGSSADDLNMPRADDDKFNQANSIQYVAASGAVDEAYQLVDFTAGTTVDGADHDGIADDRTTAKLITTLSADGTRLILTISRSGG